MKNVKQIAYASMVAVAMLFTPGAINAENVNEVSFEDSEIMLDDSSDCRIRDRNKTTGSRFKAKGDCEEVTEAYEKWKKLQ